MGILFSPQLTPTQAKIGRAHRERWARINAKSVVDTPIQLKRKPEPPTEPEPVEVAESTFDYAAYFARQEANNPMPAKPFWFSIEEIDPPMPQRIRLEDIQRAVAKRFNVSRNDLLSARRTADIVLPRQLAMYLSKKLTARSLPEIGRRFGGRDHTTVLHAVRKIETLTATDSRLADEVNILCNAIGGGDGS